ncbi:hypothetical protein ACH0R4_RS05175 [Bacillus cytotoxicus]|uniref:hypothetical protein n=1 Tax=Bacillus cereus group sp. BfR-BA-01492 TaxID=2920361 RepID=UPI001F5600A2|nr:hypothetical protein [Bacillus cereus group sp. BfR-BA-01492]EMA6342832.1 hypothetical protein [Bacillus cytotoxicus]
MLVFIDFIKQNVFLLTIVSICLSIYFYRKNKKKKELSYQEVSATPLITQLHNKVSIYIDDEEIKQNLNLVILKIFNSGNEPIKKEDFETDILIDFTNHYRSSKVFDAEIYKKNPSDLQCTVYNHELGKELGIKPLLLNPKEEVIIKLLVTDYDEIKLSSRIVGGNIVHSHKKSKTWKEQLTVSNLIFILILTGFILNYIYGIVTAIYK